MNIGTALKNYRGAIATKPFSKTGRFYFEVVVYFFIKRQLRNDLIFEVTDIFCWNCMPTDSCCVEVLRPSQPNGVMSSAVSLPNHTFTGQA